MSDTAAKADTSPVGTVLEIKSKGPVKVTRPNGFDQTVLPTDGVALYVLDTPGVFTVQVDGKATSTEAV